MSNEHRSAELSVVSDLSILPVISEFVRTEMQKSGFEQSKIFDVQMAVDEACTNIIQYAYPHDDDGRLDVSCEMKDSVFMIQIRDYGLPFDPTKVDGPQNLDADASERDLGGLGVYFMKTLMDELKYEYKEGDGFERLTMIKYA